MALRPKEQAPPAAVLSVPPDKFAIHLDELRNTGRGDAALTSYFAAENLDPRRFEKDPSCSDHERDASYYVLAVRDRSASVADGKKRTHESN